MVKKKSVKKEIKKSAKSEVKKRGWLLTTWLSLMLVLNAITFLMYILAGNMVSQMLYIGMWAIYIGEVVALLNVLFTVFLFKWKKWAFYGCCLTAVAMFIVNLIIGDYISSILGLVGLGILYLILRKKWKFLN